MASLVTFRLHATCLVTTKCPQGTLDIIAQRLLFRQGLRVTVTSVTDRRTYEMGHFVTSTVSQSSQQKQRLRAREQKATRARGALIRTRHLYGTLDPPAVAVLIHDVVLGVDEQVAVQGFANTPLT